MIKCSEETVGNESAKIKKSMTLVCVFVCLQVRHSFELVR